MQCKILLIRLWLFDRDKMLHRLWNKLCYCWRLHALLWIVICQDTLRVWCTYSVPLLPEWFSCSQRRVNSVQISVSIWLIARFCPVYIILSLSHILKYSFVFCQQTKGTSSFGKRHNKTHTLGRRCGGRTWHIQKAVCSRCAYPAKRIRKCKFHSVEFDDVWHVRVCILYLVSVC